MEEQEGKVTGGGFPSPTLRSSWMHEGQSQFSVLAREMGPVGPTFPLLILLGGNPFRGTGNHPLKTHNSCNLKSTCRVGPMKGIVFSHEEV